MDFSRQVRRNLEREAKKNPKYKGREPRKIRHQEPKGNYYPFASIRQNARYLRAKKRVV